MLTDFGGSSDIAYAVAIQPDGKIVVAGSTLVTASGLDFAVARYNAIINHLKLKAAAGTLREEDLDEVNRALQP